MEGRNQFLLKQSSYTKLRNTFFHLKAIKVCRIARAYYIFVNSSPVNEQYDVAILDRTLVDHKATFSYFLLTGSVRN